MQPNLMLIDNLTSLPIKHICQYALNRKYPQNAKSWTIRLYCF